MSDVGNDLPSNSHIKKEPKKPEKAEKVVREITTDGEVTKRKKPLGKRFIEAFIGDDIHSVASYVFFEVIIPGAKDVVSNLVTQGIDRMLYGDSVGPVNRNGRRKTVNYNQISNGSSKRQERRELSQRARSQHEFEEVVLKDRAEADEVIEQLVDLIDMYDVATVSDLLTSVGVTPSFTDERYGWYDLRTARPVRVRDGYVLNLPRPTALD